MSSTYTPELAKNTSGLKALAKPRPTTAVGPVLRIVTINDVYKLDHYPRVRSCIEAQQAMAKELDLVVISTLNGDFVAPCELTGLDGGIRMIEGLNVAGIQYVCLGNHEYDLGFAGLRRRLDGFDGTVINSNTFDEPLADLPRYETIQVGARTVLLGGFLTEDKSIYAPSTTPDVTPITEACQSLWEEVKTAIGKTPDVFLPMTHQLTKDDRATASSLAKHKELATRTPVLLAGHDHEVFIEEVGQVSDREGGRGR